MYKVDAYLTHVGSLRCVRWAFKNCVHGKRCVCTRTCVYTHRGRQGWGVPGSARVSDSPAWLPTLPRGSRLSLVVPDSPAWSPTLPRGRRLSHVVSDSSAWLPYPSSDKSNPLFLWKTTSASNSGVWMRWLITAANVTLATELGHVSQVCAARSGHALDHRDCFKDEHLSHTRLSES